MCESTVSDHLAIPRLLARHSHALDRGDLAQLSSCYHEDAVEDHGPYKGGLSGLLEYHRQAAAGITASYHLLGTPWVTVRGDRAWVITYVFSRLAYVGQDASVIRGLRYLDVVAKRADEWRIARRTVVLDWENALPDAPTIPSASSWTRGVLGANDPAIAFRQEAESARQPR